MRNLKRKIGYGTASLVLSLVLFGGGTIGEVHPSAQNRKAEKTEHLVVCKQRNCSKKAKKIKKGQKIYFGRYEQDGDRKNKGEKIAWLVLDVEKDKALLISKDILDIRAYHKENQDEVFWADSSVRKWLNKKFLNSAFSKEEKGKIVTSLVMNNKTDEGKDGGDHTKDKIFLLSLEEAKKYFKADSDRISKFTKYSENMAKKIVMKNNYFSEENFKNFVIRDKKGSWFWWLRGQGDDVFNATCVEDNGNVAENGYLAGYEHGGVRPAMWIKVK